MYTVYMFPLWYVFYAVAFSQFLLTSFFRSLQILTCYLSSFPKFPKIVCWQRNSRGNDVCGVSPLGFVMFCNKFTENACMNVCSRITHIADDGSSVVCSFISFLLFSFISIYRVGFTANLIIEKQQSSHHPCAVYALMLMWPWRCCSQLIKYMFCAIEKLIQPYDVLKIIHNFFFIVRLASSCPTTTGVRWRENVRLSMVWRLSSVASWCARNEMSDDFFQSSMRHRITEWWTNETPKLTVRIL